MRLNKQNTQVLNQTLDNAWYKDAYIHFATHDNIQNKERYKIQKHEWQVKRNFYLPFFDK